jgi:hypothetical protein
MRQLTDHKLNGLNDLLDILVLDAPGQGNANHEYRIEAYNDPYEKSGTPVVYQNISFQNGPIKEFGVNGISNEALLAIIIDRLRGFQSGEYTCEDNKESLLHAESCLEWLQKRTKDRILRGVEGQNLK